MQILFWAENNKYTQNNTQKAYMQHTCVMFTMCSLLISTFQQVTHFIKEWDRNVVVTI
jgi:hypothetical protein